MKQNILTFNQRENVAKMLTKWMIPQNVSTFTSWVYPYRVFIWLDPHTSLINTHLSKARIDTITYTPQKKKKKKKEEREKKNRLHENLPYDEETNYWE